MKATLQIAEHDVVQQVQCADFSTIHDAVAYAVDNLSSENPVWITLLNDDGTVIEIGKIHFDEFNGYGQAVFA